MEHSGRNKYVQFTRERAVRSYGDIQNRMGKMKRKDKGKQTEGGRKETKRKTGCRKSRYVPSSSMERRTPSCKGVDLLKLAGILIWQDSLKKFKHGSTSGEAGAVWILYLVELACRCRHLIDGTEGLVRCSDHSVAA
jgi:hypothetical protein